MKQEVEPNFELCIFRSNEGAGCCENKTNTTKKNPSSSSSDLMIVIKLNPPSMNSIQHCCSVYVAQIKLKIKQLKIICERRITFVYLFAQPGV
jgi:hypothetical protein